MSGWNSSGRALACVLLLVGGAAPAANYPLEITNIKPAGAGLDAQNRIFRAYPGLEYNIRAAVIGGAYPYQFSLENAPAGMSVNPRTGEVSWPNPQSDAAPTLVVSDCEGTRVTASWSVSVSTSGFRFVDAVNGRPASANGCSSSCGAGTAQSPWRTLSDVYHAGAPNEIVYFRAGTYGVLDLPRGSVGSPWERVEFNGNYRPVMWLAYPGERPLIDFGYQAGVEAGPLIRIGGTDTVYVDGFETTRTSIIGFQLGSGDNATFRRLRMHDLLVGGDGTNSAFIMTLTLNPDTSYGMVIQDSEFHTVAPEAVTIKIYSKEKLLIEDTVHHGGVVGVELKADVRRFEVRGSRFHDFSLNALGGNMHGAGTTPTTSGEIRFNNVASTGMALNLNQDGMALAIDVYRNTFAGRVRIQNTDGADGPFTFARNVIVNGDGAQTPLPGFYFENVSAPSRVVASEDLVGAPADGIIDSEGNLTAAYASYVGTRGHQLGTACGITPTPDGGVDGGADAGASSEDAGSSSDGGTEEVDAGAVVDAGPAGGEVELPAAESCACTAAPFSAGLLLALPWLLRRRRLRG